MLLVGLYLFLVRVMATRYARHHIGWLLAGLGLALSIWYIAVVVGLWLEWWDLLGRFEPPMLRPAYARILIGGPTIVAPLLVLLAVGAIGGLGVSTTRRRVVIGALAVTTLGAVFLSGTRGAWLASAGALGVVGIGVYIVHRDQVQQFTRDRRAQLVAAVLVAFSALAILAFAPTLLDRLTNSGDGGRSYYFATAQRMFEDSPLVGQGPGNWAARRIVFSEAGEPDIYVAHPHNIYLGTLAESGLIGLAAGVAALLVIIWLIAGSLRGRDRSRQRWGFAATFVLVYLGISLMVDSFANLMVVITLAAVPFAVLDATSRKGIGDGWLSLGAKTRARIHVAMTVLVFASAMVAVLVLVRNRVTCPRPPASRDGHRSGRLDRGLCTGTGRSGRRP